MSCGLRSCSRLSASAESAQACSRWQIGNGLTFLDQPALAKPPRHRREIDLRELLAGVRAEQAVRAFVDFSGADETAAREARRRDAAHARPPGMHALVPCAVGAVLGQRRCSAAGKPLRHDHLLRVKVEEPPCHHHAAEMAGDAGRLKARSVHHALGRDANACGDFDTEDVGRQQVATARAHVLTEPKRARKGTAGGMHDRARMRVVVVQSVGENAIEQHRVAQRQPDRHADHRLAAILGNALQTSQGTVGKLETGCGERRAGDIQDMEFRALAHALRQAFVGHIRGEFCKPLRDR